MILRKRTYLECKAFVDKMQNDIQYSKAVAEYRGKKITVSCTASFGLYYFTATEGTDIKNAYIEADELLSQAGNLGRNQIVAKNSHAELKLSARI